MGSLDNQIFSASGSTQNIWVLPEAQTRKPFTDPDLNFFFLKSISVHFGSSRYASCTCALKVQIQSSKVSQEPSKGLFFFFLTIPQPIKVSNLILVEPKQNAVTFWRYFNNSSITAPSLIFSLIENEMVLCLFSKSFWVWPAAHAQRKQIHVVISASRQSGE